jgi:hypothetical protein
LIDRGREGVMKAWIGYALAVLGYIGLSFLTKNFLTWTSGPVYFVVVLEVLPRSFRRLRAGRPKPAEAAR